MFTKRETLLKGLGWFYLIFQIACGSQYPTKIKDIYSDPQKYEAQKVTISGEVKESVNILMLKYYVVRDDTGEILVVAKKFVPMQGKKVQVVGIVSQTFAIGKQSYTAIFEE